MLDKCIAIAAGAAIGGVARYLVSVAVLTHWSGRFPLATFLINVSGSFAIGLAMSLFLDRYPHITLLRLFLVTGVLGGYTTFSSFEWETFETVKVGDRLTALLYVGSSVAAGYAAVWLGALAAATKK